MKNLLEHIKKAPIWLKIGSIGIIFAAFMEFMGLLDPDYFLYNTSNYNCTIISLFIMLLPFGYITMFIFDQVLSFGSSLPFLLSIILNWFIIGALFSRREIAMTISPFLLIAIGISLFIFFTCGFNLIVLLFLVINIGLIILSIRTFFKYRKH